MKKLDKNKEKSDKNLDLMSVDEFKFILSKMRLKQKNVISQSDFTRVTLYYDMQASIRTKTPLKAYWVAILHNMIGEFAFNMARSIYQQIKESRQDGKTDSIE